MGIVYCDVEFHFKEDPYGYDLAAVTVTCPLCMKSVASWGHGDSSVKRSCAILAKNCECSEFLKVEN